MFRRVSLFFLMAWAAFFNEYAGLAVASQGTQEGAQHGTPIFYYLQWVILVLILLFSVAYFVRLFRFGRPIEKRTGLGGLLVTLCFAYLALGYHPSLLHFHESPALGMVRFFVTLIAGILVAIYGILGKPSIYENAVASKSSSGVK